MDTMQIVIEPQRICPCGKAYIPMSAQERADYDKAVRNLEEDRRSRASAEKDEERSNLTAQPCGPHM